MFVEINGGCAKVTLGLKRVIVLGRKRGVFAVGRYDFSSS